MAQTRSSIRAVERLARLFYPYGSKRRVLRGPVRGMRLVVEPGLGVSYVMGREACSPRFFSARVKPGMTVFDVGANKGQMTLLFARLVGDQGHVVSLEPAPLEFHSLDRNVKLNRLENVTLLQAAASDEVGTATFLYASNNPTQGKLEAVESSYSVRGAERSTVNTISLDRVAETYRPPDLVKIDVEGAAASVLRGARCLIKRFAPTFYVELHGPEEQAGIRDELIMSGYIAETMEGTAVPDPTVGWAPSLWCFKPESQRR